MLLWDDAAGRTVVIGLALLAIDSASGRLPRIELVRAISRCLALADDSVAMSLEA